MTLPEKRDISKESSGQPRGKLVDMMQEFYVKKDAFESALADASVSLDERKRLMLALEFGYVAGRNMTIHVWNDDFKDPNKIFRFYHNILRLVKTGSYVPEIQGEQQKPETD